jgi:hypothetical protein
MTGEKDGAGAMWPSSPITARPAPMPNSGSQSGTVECGAILAFRVSVRVS